MSVQPRSRPEPAPEVVAAVQAMYARREPPLAVTVRDRLGELVPDAEFATAFGVRGRRRPVAQTSGGRDRPVQHRLSPGRYRYRGDKIPGRTD
jgi:hypothetical protein